MNVPSPTPCNKTRPAGCSRSTISKSAIPSPVSSRYDPLARCNRPDVGLRHLAEGAVRLADEHRRYPRTSQHDHVELLIGIDQARHHLHRTEHGRETKRQRDVNTPLVLVSKNIPPESSTVTTSSKPSTLGWPRMRSPAPIASRLPAMFEGHRLPVSSCIRPARLTKMVTPTRTELTREPSTARSSEPERAAESGTMSRTTVENVGNKLGTR